MSSYLPSRLSTLDVALGGGTILLLLLLRSYWSSRRHLSRPPGPAPLPLIGNVLDFPQSAFALTWTKFGEQYGPLTWLTIPGKPFLILNSLEAAKELLERRGSNYMDRPSYIMVTDLTGFRTLTPLSRSNSEWRNHRTLLKRALSMDAIRKDYAALLTQKTHEYLGCLLDQPENFMNDLRKITAELVVELTYGKLKDNCGRDFVKLHYRVSEIMEQTILGNLVDLIPSLQYLPSWLPGMKFKRDAARWKREVEDIREGMFASVKESVLSGDHNIKSSFVVNNLQALYQNQERSNDPQQLEEDERTINYSSFSFFTAGVDTISTSTQGFLMAMALFPSVQEKAQAEIDRVVGSGRLPTLDDEPDMPYLHALVVEIFRWNPGAPANLAHLSTKDDVYDGYFIPKGTSVIANTWGITRNPKYYPNPQVFDPERYLKTPRQPDPRDFALGYGRRKCPGNDLAFRAIWITAVSILWAFRLRRPEGDCMPLDTDSDRYTITILCSPNHFKCQFVPRHENLKEKLSLSVQ